MIEFLHRNSTFIEKIAPKNLQNKINKILIQS